MVRSSPSHWHAAANSSCDGASTQIAPVGTAIGAAIEAGCGRGERRTGALWEAGEILRVTIRSTGVPLPVTSDDDQERRLDGAERPLRLRRRRLLRDLTATVT
jgi:hypothetical protein